MTPTKERNRRKHTQYKHSGNTYADNIQDKKNESAEKKVYTR
jgi:hypothetical protein